MRRLLLLPTFLLACQHSPARAATLPAPAQTSTPAALTARPGPETLPPPSPPADPPPPAAVAAPWFADLPAIAEDGTTLAVANHFALGARGEERLLLDLIDVATDRLVRRVIVSDPDHLESNAGGEAKARRVLAERRWSKLTTYDDDAAGEGLAVEYREPVLVVRDVAAGAEMLRKTERTWSKLAGRPCPECNECPAPPASIARVWGDRSRHVLLAGIGFRGESDICWEPTDEYHVVVLPE
jgi:hypothetical protein